MYQIKQITVTIKTALITGFILAGIFCSSTSKIIPLNGEDKEIADDFIENQHYLYETSAIITIKTLHKHLIQRDYKRAIGLLGPKTRMKLLKTANEKHLSEIDILKKGIVKFTDESNKDLIQFLIQDDKITFKEEPPGDFSAKNVTIIAQNTKGETTTFHLRMVDVKWKIELE